MMWEAAWVLQSDTSSASYLPEFLTSTIFLQAFTFLSAANLH
jgi:hypothetical protein